MLIAKKTVYDRFKTGDRFRELRKKHGFSMRQLSDLLDIGEQSLYRWEEGKIIPKVDHLLILCKLYGGLTVNDLLVYTIVEEGEESPSSFFV